MGNLYFEEMRWEDNINMELRDICREDAMWMRMVILVTNVERLILVMLYGRVPLPQ